VNYVYVEHNVRQRSFETAAVTLEEAEAKTGGRDYFEIIEQNMETGVQTPVSDIKERQSLKGQLVDLYKSGFKRKAFEGLDARIPFQNQLNFPIAPEIEKINAKRLAAKSN
jgi:hypothetical protein